MSIERLLNEYGVSKSSGFLPRKEPLRRLPSQYYAPWEEAIRSLPKKIATGSVHDTVNTLPLLSTSNLRTESEWQRAYVVLTFLIQAYIWSGERPTERIPPQLATPLSEVSRHLDLPPTATYASLVLWNFAFQSPLGDMTDPENLRSLHTTTGLKDEEWFYLISVALESRGGPIVMELLRCMDAAILGDDMAVINSLMQTTVNIRKIGVLLERMYERCDPQTYYHDIRPLLAGTKGMSSSGLPNGVCFDYGGGIEEWHQYSGGSNGQSSLIQFLDIALGINHNATGSDRGRSHEAGAKSKANGYIQEIRNYMPGPHRRFLATIEKLANIRSYALSETASTEVTAAYDETVMALSKFRDIHIQIVTRYIITPSRSPPAAHVMRRTGINLASASSQAGKAGSEKPQLYGTGGTDLIPFLKQTRDETREAASR